MQKVTNLELMRKLLEENPILVSDSTELEELKEKYQRKQRIKYICSKCGTESYIRLENFRKNDNLLCSKCLKVLAWKIKDTKVLQKQKEQTMRLRYGENYKEIINQKRKNTFAEKPKSFWKEKEQKQIKTCLAKYGTTNPGAAKQAREKAKQTSLKKYGVEYFSQNKYYQKERKFLCLQKYGVDCTLKLDSVKRKRIDTLNQKYGVSSPLKNREIENKRENTLKQKYGKVRTPSYNYIYDDQIFDSSWELAVWIYCKDNDIAVEREPCTFEYVFDNKIHKYIPDFKIDNKLVELKGSQFFENEKMINPFDRTQDDFYEAKYRCALSNHVVFWGYKEIKIMLDYVRNRYGENFLKSFKKN